MYVVVKSEKLSNGRIKNTELVSSARMVDVVKTLAELLDDLTDDDGVGD